MFDPGNFERNNLNIRGSMRVKAMVNQMEGKGTRTHRQTLDGHRGHWAYIGDTGRI